MTDTERRGPGHPVPTRFQSKYTPQELLDLTEVVSRHALPDAPASCTQAQFDEARGPSGHPDLPRARAIAARLNLPWPKLLEVIHNEDRDAWKTVAASQGRQGRKGVSLGEVYRAMRHVAGYLGQNTLSRAEYEQGRDSIVAADRRAYRHGGRAERALPALHQLEELTRRNGLTWADALRNAGLAEFRQKPRAALTPVEAVRGFARDTGYAPRGLKQLRAWGAATGQAVKEHRAPEMNEAIETVNEERLAAGEPAVQVAPRGLTLQYAGHDTAATGSRVVKGRSKDELIDGMVIAITYLRPGENLGVRELKRIAKAHPGEGIPSSSTVQRQAAKVGETFADWRDEALERRRRGNRRA